jgi:hypothetical protein
MNKTDDFTVRCPGEIVIFFPLALSLLAFNLAKFLLLLDTNA